MVVSCETEDVSNETIKSEHDLVEYIRSKGNEYTFHDTQDLSKKNFTKPKPIYFETLEELDSFLNSMENLKKNLRDKPSVSKMNNYLTYNPGSGGPSGGSNGGYKVDSFYLGWEYGVDMNVGFYVDRWCNGSNVNSWISGVTLGVSYDHIYGTIDNASWNPNLLQYQVDGIFHYNIFFEGIGTIFSENIDFAGSYTCE